MRSTITSMFSTSIRICATLSVSAVIMQMQACSTTIDQEIRHEALREARLYSVRFFVDECIASGGNIYGPKVDNHRDPVINIPESARIRQYYCGDADVHFVDTPEPSYPASNVQAEGRMK